jgi:hypothetical protein
LLLLGHLNIALKVVAFILKIGLTEVALTKLIHVVLF